MFTDMVGYTASTQVNEVDSLRLREEQEELLRPVFVAHQGRVVKSTGDGFLVEFPSALRAVQCAIEVTERIRERNVRAEGAPLRLRIGIHLGDVEPRGEDIFGDAVNIAARIEPLAEPGGICLSGPVFDQVHNKVPYPLEKLEPTHLKNVRFPVEVYRVVLARRARPGRPPTGELTGLAVLPFTNISPDPNDAYFSDGLTEELITVLSQLGGLRVIARTSVMRYKSTPKGVAEVGAELRVGAILEGSVRKAGNRIRVTAQLIDVRTEGHLWAKTFDRDLDDVLAVQVELANAVAEALQVSLPGGGNPRLASRPPVRSDSYLAYLKGRTLVYGYNRSSLASAKAEFERAIALDPTNAAAHSGLADVTRILGGFFPEFPREEWDRASRRLATRAVELDPNLGEAHASLAVILWDDYDYAGAEHEFQVALALNPSYAWAHNSYGGMLEDQGRAHEALDQLLLAEAADPLGTLQLLQLGFLFTWLGRWEEALDRIHHLGELEPSHPWYRFVLAHYYLAHGEREQGLAEMERWEELESDPRRKPIIRATRLALGGQPEEARALLRREETLPAYEPTLWLVAVVYAYVGDLDDGFRWLERAVDRHSIAFQSIRLDPRLEPMRRDPRFHRLLKRMNLG
jgi:adenylate cyclase